MRKLGLGEEYYKKVDVRHKDTVGLYPVFSEFGIENELGGYFSHRIESIPFRRFEGIGYGVVTSETEDELFVYELYLDGELVGELLYELYEGQNYVLDIVRVADHDKEKEVMIALYEEAIEKIRTL